MAQDRGEHRGQPTIQEEVGEPVPTVVQHREPIHLQGGDEKMCVCSISSPRGIVAMGPSGQQSSRSRQPPPQGRTLRLTTHEEVRAMAKMNGADAIVFAMAKVETLQCSRG